jgi:hypothetical protein
VNHSCDCHPEVRVLCGPKDLCNLSKAAMVPANCVGFVAKNAPQDDKCDTEKLNRSRNYVAEKMNHEPNVYGADGVTREGAAVYTPLALAFYDLVVLEFSNSFVWQCPSHVLLDFYNQHISHKHLDIGVGTGYFLDRCRFRSTAPKIALFDLNPHSLAKSAKRLRRYNPSCYLGNVLQRIDIGMSGFGSISLNYLLHCLPGNLASKSIVFEHVKPLLRAGGVISALRFWAKVCGTTRWPSN